MFNGLGMPELTLVCYCLAPLALVVALVLVARSRSRDGSTEWAIEAAASESIEAAEMDGMDIDEPGGQGA
jgi:hypothetical protein